MYITLIDPQDGSGPQLAVEQGAPTLEQMQAVVDGYIEPMFTVRSPHRDAEDIWLSGYVNEEGLCINLPITMAVQDFRNPTLRDFNYGRAPPLRRKYGDFGNQW